MYPLLCSEKTILQVLHICFNHHWIILSTCVSSYSLYSLCLPVHSFTYFTMLIYSTSFYQSHLMSDSCAQFFCFCCITLHFQISVFLQFCWTNLHFCYFQILSTWCYIIFRIYTPFLVFIIPLSYHYVTIGITNVSTRPSFIVLWNISSNKTSYQVNYE